MYNTGIIVLIESKIRKLCIVQGFTLGIKGFRKGCGNLKSW